MKNIKLILAILNICVAFNIYGYTPKIYMDGYKFKSYV